MVALGSRKSPFSSRWFLLLALVTSAVGALATTVFFRRQLSPQAGYGDREVIPGERKALTVSLDDQLPLVYFGGFYAAAEQGLYLQQGLELKFVRSTLAVAPAQYLVSGSVHLHIGSAFDAFAAAQKGLPVKAVAAFIQRSGLGVNLRTGSDGAARVLGKPLDALVERPSEKPFETPDNGLFYSAVVLSAQNQIENDSPMIKRFLEASALGWKSYFASPDLAHQSLLKQFPEVVNPEALMQQYTQLRHEELEKEIVPVEGGGNLVLQDVKKMHLGETTTAGWSQTFRALTRNNAALQGDYSPQEAFTLKLTQK